MKDDVEGNAESIDPHGRLFLLYTHSMRRYVMLDKKIGQTPLEALNEWRAAHARYRATPASYAGRLDPMASGKLLILLGDECKRQDAYTGLDKEYEIEILLDVGSDTGDILGLVSGTEVETHPTRTEIQTALAKELGTHPRPYPAYSSKTVNGKPLFLYALEGTLGTIEIPVHDETIHRIRLLSIKQIEHDALIIRVVSLLALAPTSDEPSKALGADFRIHDVRNSWAGLGFGPKTYTVLKLRVTCGTGTYMRSLAERVGATLGTRALALSIRRTKIFL